RAAVPRGSATSGQRAAEEQCCGEEPQAQRESAAPGGVGEWKEAPRHHHGGPTVRHLSQADWWERVCGLSGRHAGAFCLLPTPPDAAACCCWSVIGKAVQLPFR
ncbi:unnamed protein product, partial [Closterium sp. NIES-54]